MQRCCPHTVQRLKTLSWRSVCSRCDSRRLPRPLGRVHGWTWMRWPPCIATSTCMDVSTLSSDPAVPDTFDAHLNGSNVWSGIEENLALYRLEAVSFALKGGGVDETELEHAVVERNRTGATPAQVNAAGTALARMCAAWNLGRHRRPAFATTEPEIDHLLHDPGEDWPHALREHLGLGHISPWQPAHPSRCC